MRGSQGAELATSTSFWASGVTGRGGGAPVSAPLARRGLPKRRDSILSLGGRVSSGGDLRYIPTHSLLYLHRGDEHPTTQRFGAWLEPRAKNSAPLARTA